MKKLFFTIFALCLIFSTGFSQAHKDGAHKGGGLIQIAEGAAEGDIIYWNGSAWTLLNIGSNTYVLTSNGTTVSWAAGGGSDSTWTSARVDTLTLGDDTDNVDGLFQMRGSAGLIWNLYTDDATDQQLIWETTATTAAADDDPLFMLLFPASPDANQELWGIYKGTQASKSNVLSADEDGDLKFGANGSLSHTGQRLTTGSNNFIDLDQALWQTNNTNITIDADLGDAADINLGVEATDRLFVSGLATQQTYVVRNFVSLTGATDDAATAFFTITTTDETGSADGGAYSVTVHLMTGEALAASGATNISGVSLVAHWIRAMQSAGTGANTAITEISESAAADQGSGAISAVTLTVAETSEFVQTVSLQVNTSGGTFDGFAMVELVYSDFTTPPAIN